MNDHAHGAARALNDTLRHLGIRDTATAGDDGVTLPWAAAQQVLSSIAFIEGGNGAPFVTSLLRTRPRTDVVLRGDEPHLLRRALEDLHRQKRRNAQIDRGQIPGALSGAEVSRLVRRHPHMFTQAARKDGHRD